MARRKKSTKWKWAAYAAMFLGTSGGGGGYLLKDHPMLASLLQSILGDVQEDKPVGEAVAGRIKQVVSDRVAGRFEVKVKSVQLGAEASENRRAPSLQLVVKRQDAQGVTKTVWESEPVPAKQEVGNGPWAADFSASPFQVDWKPGEEVFVEVVQTRGFRRPTTFVMHDPKTDRFPLAQGSHTLKMDGVDNPSGKNTITFQTSRLGNLAVDATATLIQDVSRKR
jgi:hypothetical protein